nr:MAG TPA: hypothetical protein [Caudoviricetes sp.]
MLGGYLKLNQKEKDLEISLVERRNNIWLKV